MAGRADGRRGTGEPGRAPRLEAIVALSALLAVIGASGCVSSESRLRDLLATMPEHARHEIDYVIAQEARLATRAKHLETMGSLRALGTALGSYQVDYNFYPLALSYLEPSYIAHLIPGDGWGNRFTYDCDEMKRSTYALSSPGQDHAFGTADDYVYEDGQFLSWPEPRQLRVEPLELPGADPPPPPPRSR